MSNMTYITCQNGSCAKTYNLTEFKNAHKHDDILKQKGHFCDCGGLLVDADGRAWLTSQPQARTFVMDTHFKKKVRAMYKRAKQENYPTVAQYKNYAILIGAITEANVKKTPQMPPQLKPLKKKTRIRVKEMTFLDNENKTTRTVYTVQLKCYNKQTKNYEWSYIHDDSTLSGIIECKTETDAKQRAINERELYDNLST